MTESPVRANILVVDDTPANLGLLEVMLRRQGWDVRPMPNGRLALLAAENDPPDLILLDINMPEMNGFEVCNRLKQNPITRNIPVLFISALDGSDDKIRALEIGGVDYITKPFQIEEVLARVRTHLKIKGLQEELRVQNAQLHASLEDLRELEKLRDNLVQMIIHDLRSPLTGISGFLDLLMLEKDALNERHLGYIASIRGSTDTLLRMICDLLDVGRLESNNMPIHTEFVELNDTVREALEALGAMVRDYRVVIESDVASAVVQADRNLVRRVLTNLLANAFRFSSFGSEVRIGLRKDESGIRVCVRDEGPGVPRDQQEKIFEKFGRVEGQGGGKGYSTGLGLTFCQLAVEAHGGLIGVESEVGQGSEFWFTLPAPSAAD